MDVVVRAYPLRNGDRTALEGFIQELREKREETEAFYAGYGVTRETWHLQETPHGTWVIGVTELTDAVRRGDVADRYKAATADFDAWFKGRVLELTGVDPNEDPLGPPTTCVFDSTDL